MSNLTPTSSHTHAAPTAPSALKPPYPGALEADFEAQERLGLTPEQAGIMDLLEGRVLRAPLPAAVRGATGKSLQRDVVLALVGGLCLVSGLVAIFFMAALGAVLLVVGALFCVAAYEHAVAIDAAATLEQNAGPKTYGHSLAAEEDSTATLL